MALAAVSDAIWLIGLASCVVSASGNGRLIGNIEEFLACAPRLVVLSPYFIFITNGNTKSSHLFFLKREHGNVFVRS